MDKYSTCLTPFLFHLLSLLVEGKLTESCCQEYIVESDEYTDSSMTLQKRKSDIFQKTKNLLSISVGEREEFFEKRRIGQVCGLCMTCIGCEQEYWKEAERLLNGESVRARYNLPKEISELLVQREKPEEVYVKNYLLTKQMYNYRNTLVMLKGFSSSTPFLLNHSLNTNDYSGGGFYLNWNGFGIAVDPGYHFVQNLHRNGLNILDIDAVVITHEHIDHSSDMRLLDDLHYHASKNYRDEEFQWDTENERIRKNRVPRHKIKWYMDEVTYQITKLLCKKGSGFAPECNEIYCIRPEHGRIKSEELSKYIQLQVFQTRHEERKDDRTLFLPHTYGCVFSCENEDGTFRKIGYTSDTAFHKDVVPIMCKVMKECDIIIENISGIYENDILLKVMKEKHLGYYGCYKLIDEIHREPENKLRYVLLSEFSNLVNDIRFEIAKYMQDDVHNTISTEIAIYPAEVGMVISLEGLSVQCSECCRYTRKPIVVKQDNENSQLRYCCEQCTYRV